MKIADDREVAEAVWAETLEQCADDKKWVQGPFDAEQITQRQGAHWIPAKRFGVRQGGKFAQLMTSRSTSSMLQLHATRR